MVYLFQLRVPTSMIGSNVQGIETTITYDRARDELIVNTPVETAQKHWLGGALSAMMAVTFGQLFVDGENKGVHAVIVPMRDQHGALLPGIAIADCGHKQGNFSFLYQC